MKWWYALLAVVLVLPVAHADVKNRVHDADDFFTAFNENIMTARCPFEMDNVYAGGFGLNFWPVDGPCSELVNERYDFGEHTIRIRRVAGGDYNDSRVAYIEGFFYSKDGQIFGDEHYDYMITRDLAKNALDRFDPPQARNGMNVSKIFTIAWCGERLTAEYTSAGGTLSPETLFFSVDDENGGECTAKAVEERWGKIPTRHPIDADLRGFFSTKNNSHFYTLPLKQMCGSYAIEVVDRSHTDWPAIGITPIVELPADHHEKTISNGNNELTVTLKTEDDQLQSIRIDGNDKSGDNGGLLINILCVNPVDADTTADACRLANGNWHSTADANYTNKCCGDDSASDMGDQHKDLVCEQNNNAYKWNPLASKCEYPAGWIIYGPNGSRVNTSADAKQPRVYYPGGGCCSVPENIGKRVNSGNDESICVVQIDNRTRWFTASTSSRVNTSAITNLSEAALRQQLQSFNQSRPVTIASNRTDWLLCGLEANQMPVAETCDYANSISDPSICYGSWIKYEQAKGYYLDNASRPLFDRTGGPDQDKAKAAGTCSGGDANSNMKYNPRKNDFGFCASNQCYLNQSTCINYGTWAYNDFCTAVNNITDWETRTRFLAEALYNTTNNAPFILHCDNSPEAINEYQNIIPYEQNALVNSFCVLTKGDTITVGVTLSPPGGAGNASPAVYGDNLQPALPPFVRLLNNTDFGNQSHACANALESMSYHECEGFTNTTGKVYYNNQYGTLVLSKTTFSPQPSFFDGIRRWWNGAVNGQAQLLMPFGGHKMYFAKGSSGNSIQGRLVYIAPKGETEAKIVGVKMNDLYNLCESQREKSNRTTCAREAGDITIVTIKQPTQNEWELFTLRIRPE